MVALLTKNVHVGSMGDIITYPIDVDPDLNISKVQLLDAILHELSSNGFSDSEASDESCGFKKAEDASPMFITSLWT